MKKYLGTKEVQAQSMSAELAISKGFKTSTCLGKDEGYEVVYKDGYSSWSPKGIFDEAYKICETPLDRLHIEHDELLNKYNKLVTFLSRKDATEIVGKEQLYLMERQLNCMREYKGVLNRRIELMEAK